MGADMGPDMGADMGVYRVALGNVGIIAHLEGWRTLCAGRGSGRLAADIAREGRSA